jgi:hypothetical protein
MKTKPKNALPIGDLWMLIFIAIEAAAYLTGGALWTLVTAIVALSIAALFLRG